MNSKSSDRDIERDRYDQRASASVSSTIAVTSFGSSGISFVLRAPYIAFEFQINKCILKNMRIVEFAAGTGSHTFALARSGAKVLATDISSVSLDLLKSRLASIGLVVETCVADLEQLPLESNSFDVITCAGGISYGDPDNVNSEVLRLLKPGGSFICVDSLNHNPIYRFNRWIHWRIKKDRTRSTLIRMPTITRMRQLGEHFESWELEGFGAASWLLSPLSRIIGSSICARLSTLCDRLPGARRMAFKFVFVARGLKKTSHNAT